MYMHSFNHSCCLLIKIAKRQCMFYFKPKFTALQYSKEFDIFTRIPLSHV